VARDDIEDVVFDHAVATALESVRRREPSPDLGRLRSAVEAARPWVMAREERGTRLAVVTEKLIADEFDRVRKTTGDALTAENQEGVSALLRVLVEPSDDLRDYRKAIQASYEGEDPAIRNLRDRTAARIEFLAVVRDYFTDDLAEVVPAQVDALARARRYAGSNPATGLALLEEFSSAWTARPAPKPQPQ
jgi:hypothetical protein